MIIEKEIIWILLAFILGWIGLSYLISLLGGWSSLSKLFPVEDYVGNEIKKFYWKSISIGYFSSYSNCINIKVTDFGIVLNTIALFPFHPPIYIKWEKLSNVVLKTSFFKKSVFEVDGKRLSIYGNAGLFIISEYRKHSAADR